MHHSCPVKASYEKEVNEKKRKKTLENLEIIYTWTMKTDYKKERDI